MWGRSGVGWVSRRWFYVVIVVGADLKAGFCMAAWELRGMSSLICLGQVIRRAWC